MTSPQAKRIPHTMSLHGDVRTDDYYWLRDRENAEVIAYLEAENAYTKASLAAAKPLEETLFAEMKGRIKEDDNSVPFFEQGYWYYIRYESGQEYPLHCRKKETLEAAEELFLDENEHAEDHDFYQVGGVEISPNNAIAGFCEDTVGRRFYDIYFKNLQTGEMLPDILPQTAGDFVFAADSQTILYVRQHPDTLRAYQVWKHVLGTPVDADTLVFEEADETFNVGVGKTKSRKYLQIASSSTVSDEVYVLLSENPQQPQLFQPRERDLEYSLDHYNDTWYIVTNYQAKNFRLMTCADSGSTHKEVWQELIPHREGVLLEGFELFQQYLVLEERTNGLMQLRVRTWDGTKDSYVPFFDPAYIAGTGANPELNTDWLRYGYASMTTPSSTIDYNMATGETIIRKQQTILGGFEREKYRSERVFVTAADGAQIPVSVVYHVDTPIDGTAPLLLYAYGSYGISLDAGFSSTRLSLLNRGFVFAIAHIRGGSEMGRAWYENGKMLHKKNTFTDFIACGEYLVQHRYGAANKLFAMGGSAGGLLMGAVINLRPEMWRGIIAAVPFVDVVTTMLDDSIPLTTGEYDEWGNPNNAEYYHYIKSYSPYDNVEAKAYPNMLVTTGLHDSQVQYWEPAKWVAKLRELKTDSNMLLLHTNMEAGHGGATGRFHALHEVAMEYAFLIELAK